MSHMQYVRICMGERPFCCSYPGCEYRCSTSQSLLRHVKRHVDPFPFTCNFPGCNFRTAMKGNISRHMNTHSLEGQIRRKNQENRINKMLRKWGYTADLTQRTMFLVSYLWYRSRTPRGVPNTVQRFFGVVP